MPNRTLRIGDTVAIRPSAERALRREGYKSVPLHERLEISDCWTNGVRLVFALSKRVSTLEYGEIAIAVWASQVRLYDGAEERLHRRCEKLAIEIEKMKAARRRAKKRGKRK